MNEPSRESMPTKTSSSLRRLFGPHQWPKLLFAAACVGTLVVLWLALENRRNLQAQGAVSAGAIAQAERAIAAKIIPPPVPDEDNFAATPLFASLFDKSVDRGDSEWPEDFTRADQLPRSTLTLAESREGRKTGRFMTDLAAWEKAFEQSRDGIANEEIVVSDTPNLATNAQAALV